MNTQMDWIRGRLERGDALTPIDALRGCGCFRLGARIWDLRREGMGIGKRMVKTGGGACVAEYRKEL